MDDYRFDFVIALLPHGSSVCPNPLTQIIRSFHDLNTHPHHSPPHASSLILGKSKYYCLTVIEYLPPTVWITINCGKF